MAVVNRAAPFQSRGQASETVEGLLVGPLVFHILLVTHACGIHLAQFLDYVVAFVHFGSHCLAYLCAGAAVIYYPFRLHFNGK